MLPGEATGDHVCVLDREYPAEILGCRCGRFWMTAGTQFRVFAFVDYDLRQRLRNYRLDIEFGKYADLRDAVKQEAAKARADRIAARAADRERWHRRQEAKRSAWFRHVRAIILSDPCAYCGGAATDIDHVIPLSQGGSGERRNLAASCHSCNSEKGKKTPAEWKAWRLAKGRPWPPHRTALAA